jgi:hypothetical protein
VTTGRGLRVLAALAGVAFLTCSVSGPDLSQTDESNCSETVTFVYEPAGQGYAPADSTGVTLMQSGADPRTALPAASGTTDSLGRFAVDSLPEGTYTVLCKKGPAASYLAGVTVAYDPQGNVSPDTIRDTLDSPGSLSGFVALLPGHDRRTVFVLPLGTNTIAMCDSLGAFTLAGMAKGAYTVRILSTRQDYGVLDTTLSIAAGVDTALDDTIHLPYLGIPAVENLMVEYDTMMQTVTIRWHGLESTRVEGYTILRREQGGVYTTPLSASIITDTFHIDSFPTQSTTYHYAVAAVDTSGNQADTQAETPPVFIASAYETVRVIDDSTLFDKPVGLVVVNDRIYVADDVRQCVTVVDTLGTYLFEFGNQAGAGQLTQPVEIAAWGENVYVLDQASDVLIHIYDTAGSFRQSVTYPPYLVVDLSVGDDSTIYILDDSQRKVVALDRTGAVTAQSVYGLTGPMALALTATAVLVADGPSGNVVEMAQDLSGGTAHAVGVGHVQSETPAARNLAVDESGDVYVALGSLDPRVAVFDSSFACKARFVVETAPSAAAGPIADLYAAPGGALCVATTTGSIAVVRIRP